MRRLWYVLFCVFLIQRAIGQPICQPDLYISMDDFLRAINNRKLNLNQENPIGQDVCGSQQDVISQDTCGSQENLINTQLFPISNQRVSYDNQISSFQPTFEVDRVGCSYQQPSISFPSQSSLSIGCQSSGCQPSISLNQPCGCSIQQPLNSYFSPPCLSTGCQSCGCEPSISLNQPCGCSIQEPSISLPSPRSFSIGSQSSGCQPSISLGGSQSGCGNQPSSSLDNLCGYQPSLSVNQKPSLSFVSQPTISLPNQPCGSQQSISASIPSLSLQCGSSNQLSVQPTLSFNGLSSQSCQIGANSQQASSNQCSSKTQSRNTNVANASSKVFNIGNNIVSVVPNALLQAPPFGLFFDGDNLIIDGAVQVCGTMPFNSAVWISGVLPASGAGNVQYVCEDIC